ncbi:hypothetical protein CK203_106926 [Vitis vinifera]|uniref:Uncharacterized protein n=1 Tax=Vitis vinifera TaxID=29760 RepID=A0A438CDW1_VITVI|nr:hypothetical protein CK203_106926 [Vitis vinifera]
MGGRATQSLMNLLATSKLPIGATHFALAYRMEVIIPTEIDMPTAKQLCKIKGIMMKNS